jgi:hypothetical protein
MNAECRVIGPDSKDWWVLDVDGNLLAGPILVNDAFETRDRIRGSEVVSASNLADAQFKLKKILMIRKANRGRG